MRHNSQSITEPKGQLIRRKKNRSVPTRSICRPTTTFVAQTIASYYNATTMWHYNMVQNLIPRKSHCTSQLVCILMIIKRVCRHSFHVLHVGYNISHPQSRCLLFAANAAAVATFPHAGIRMTPTHMRMGVAPIVDVSPAITRPPKSLAV